MKIDKAIEKLANVIVAVDNGFDPEAYEALNLGLEALKAIKLTREDTQLGRIVWLAGETE